MKKILAIVLAVWATLPMAGKVTMPAFFGDGMMLQQQTDASLWGVTSNKERAVTIFTSWNCKSYRVVADKNGVWRVKVQTPSYGGPYEITINDGKILVIKDVKIGEVWLCAGQSNMHMGLNGKDYGPMLGTMEAITSKLNSDIRVFNIGHKFSNTPENECTGEWQKASPEFLGNFPAAAYYFAKKINEVLGVPVGLIHASYGGSTVHAWMSKEAVEPWSKLPEIQDRSILFNGVLNPIVGFSIKGALWYQGEANVEIPDLYMQMFPAMVADWRKRWGEGDFPFYYAQIAPFNYNKGEGKGKNSAYLREVQTKCLDVIPNSGMAILTDVGDARTIHPMRKQPVGNRFAYLALSKTYGVKGFPPTGPTYKNMVVNGKEAELFFDNMGGYLTSFHEPLTDFEIAGEDKVFYPAHARFGKANKSVIVTSDKVPRPVAVRYAFKDYVKGCLFNIYGLPATSFRTDDW